MGAEKLRKRPFKITKAEDINPEQLERILGHYDDRILELDKRRIAQQSTLSTSATLSQVITALNTLIQALNGEDLTED